LEGLIVALVTRYVFGNFMKRDAIQTVFEHLTLFPMVCQTVMSYLGGSRIQVIPGYTLLVKDTLRGTPGLRIRKLAEENVQ
jgi:hypothetical protein